MLRVIAGNLFMLLLLTAFVQAADWPMWRCDAARSAVGKQTLAKDLSHLWTRRLSVPRPAWLDKSNYMIGFDRHYEPIVAGKQMFVGSMNEDTVTAYDTDTGAVQWVFFTGGPVRFAPVAYKGKVFAGSDDGCLYCLDAKTGKQIWRFRAVPKKDLVLGNTRVISRWPLRGAPVIYKDVLYFAAGVWSFEGIFIYAVNPEDGSEIWCNSESGTNWSVQQHNSPAFANVCPQGYLAASENVLLVPSGRAVPGGYDLATGKFLYWHGGSRKVGKNAGGYAATIAEEYFCNRNAIYELATGKVKHKSLPGLIRGKHVYQLRKEMLNIVSLDTGKPIRSVPVKGVLGTPMAMTGDDLLCGNNDGNITLIDCGSKGVPTVKARLKADGPIRTLLAADGKLFAVTESGAISCFGPGKSAAKVLVDKTIPFKNEDGAVTKAINDLVKAKANAGGYALVIGADAREAITALLTIPDIHVVVVESRRAVANALRNQGLQAGVYGRRLAVVDVAPDALPPYLAEIMVVAKTARLDADKLASLYRALRPYGGTMLLPGRSSELRSLAKARSLPKGDIGAIQGMGTLTRAGALEGAGSWTHQYADAGNTVMSADKRVKSPLGLLWYGGTTNDAVLPRHGHGPNPQVAGGRLTIQGRDMLRSIDVYTGRLLWEHALKDVGFQYRHTFHHPGANLFGSNYVSLSDAVYLMKHDHCRKLNPATGKVEATFRLPPIDDKTVPNWGTIRVYDKYLIAAGTPVTVPFDSRGIKKEKKKSRKKKKPIPVKDATPDPKLQLPGIKGIIINDKYSSASQTITVMDRHTGKVLWQRKAQSSFRHNAIVAGDGILYCIDRMSLAKRYTLRRRGMVLKDEGALYALDLATGKVIWETKENVFGTWLGYSREKKILLQASARAWDRPRDELGKGIVVYKGATGKIVWKNLETEYTGPLILFHDQFITNYRMGKGFSLMTGKESGWGWMRTYGCNTAIASEHLILYRSASAGYYDLKNRGGTINLGGFKSGCSSNMIPADGVIAIPDYTRTCICSYQNQSSLGLVHRPDTETWAHMGTPLAGRIGINLGAEGDRMSADKTYWIEHPASGSPEVLKKEISVEGGSYYQHHSLLFRPHPMGWVTSSGLEGAAKIAIPVKDGTYRVKLLFAEPDRSLKVGQRVFDIHLGKDKGFTGFDILAAAKGMHRATVVKECRNIRVTDSQLTIVLKATSGKSLLCGIEIIEDND